jgi:hypothetical protein
VQIRDGLCVGMTDTQTGHRPRRRRRLSTDATRAQRNQRLVADRISGMTWAAIADKYSLSLTQVRTIYRDHRDAAGVDAAPLSLAVDPNAMVIRVVRDHEWAAERLRELAEKADNTSAAVGAAKGVAAVGVQLLAVLRGAGLLPQHGWQWLSYEQWEATVRDMVRAGEADGLAMEQMRRHVEQVMRLHGSESRAELRVAA